MLHLGSSSKMNFFEKPYAPLYGGMFVQIPTFFPRYRKKGWKILSIMLMQNFPDDKGSACFMFHLKTDLKTKKSSGLSSDSADPAFISPQKKNSSFRHVQISC